MNTRTDTDSMFYAWTLTLLCALVWLTEPLSAQGRLGQIRHEVREQRQEPVESTEAETTKKTKQSYHRDDNHEDDDSFGTVVLGVVGGGVLVAGSLPFWGPVYLLGDDYEKVGVFQEVPYNAPYPGSMRIDPIVDRAFSKVWLAHAEGQYVEDFDRISTMGGRFLFDTAIRLGFDGEGLYRREDLGQGTHDGLWTGDANILFRFAQSEHIQMRTGLGINWLADSIDSDFGFNFTYSIDWYPSEPLVFQSELDLGYIGNASVVHLRGTGGLIFGRVEAYLGYDFYQIGGVDLSGMVTGVRLWF